MRLGKVLVTGSSSFTGYYVLNELAAHGYTVLEPPKKDIDLRDYESVFDWVNTVRPNYVIHLAALSFVGHGDINEIYETNLLGSINLLRALVESKLNLRKVVLASSANIYGNVNEKRIRENQPATPANHYGISKHAMELAADQWKDRLPIVIVRPFNYTGVGQAGHFLVPKIVNHFRDRKIEIELGNIDVYRDFSDVRDVASWYIELLSSGSSVNCVNFCTGVLTSLRDIICMLNDIAGYEIRVKVNSAFVRENEIKELCGDNTLLLSLTSDKKVRSFKETLEWMYGARD